jgi:hypothetical protein
MQLHGTVRHRESDAGAAFFCREVKLKNFIANIAWNAGAIVDHVERFT